MFSLVNFRGRKPAHVHKYKPRQNKSLEEDNMDRSRKLNIAAFAVLFIGLATVGWHYRQLFALAFASMFPTQTIGEWSAEHTFDTGQGRVKFTVTNYIGQHQQTEDDVVESMDELCNLKAKWHQANPNKVVTEMEVINAGRYSHPAELILRYEVTTEPVQSSHYPTFEHKPYSSLISQGNNVFDDQVNTAYILSSRFYDNTGRSESVIIPEFQMEVDNRYDRWREDNKGKKKVVSAVTITGGQYKRPVGKLIHYTTISN